MKFLKWRQRKKIAPIHLSAGDTLSIVTNKTYTITGIPYHKDGSEKVLLKEDIGRSMDIDEVGTFDAEVEGRDAIGAIIINEDKK